MEELPPAILADILSRVSGELLLRFRCVCKRWREAIDDSYFRNSLHCSKERVLLHHKHKQEEIYLLKLQEERPMEMIQIAKFPELKGYLLQGVRNNGFLLFRHLTDIKNNPELLINPLTKEIMRLPRASVLEPNKSVYLLDFCWSVYGLGFDRSANTHKMLQIEKNYGDEETRTNSMGSQVYDFEKRWWGNCKPPPCLLLLYNVFFFASGALNWFLSTDKGTTLSFDLTNKEFSLIPGRCIELGGSLARFRYPETDHVEVWDSTSREWTRKYRIDTGGKFYCLVGQYNSDKLIFRSSTGLYLYDVNKKRFGWCGTEDDAWYPVDMHDRRAIATLSLASLERHFREETSARL